MQSFSEKLGAYEVNDTVVMHSLTEVTRSRHKRD